MTTLAVEASNIHYSYHEAGEKRQVLSDVSLSIGEGECLALLGESGSGKSTLLNLLGGIDVADSGSINIRGQSLDAMREPALTHFRRQHIGFIYQLFNLIPTLTVAENIALPLELANIPADQREEQTRHWLQKVGLEQRGQAFPDQLSGGEQQRVAVARALIHAPAIVLADEPTGNLDLETGQRILDLLTTLAKESRQTLLLVTHSKTVADAADRVLVLEQGLLRDGGDSKLAW